MRSYVRPWIAVIFGIMSIVSFLLCEAVMSIKEYQFDKKCKQYIKLVADASSIELATEYLEKAIVYCENNDLTEGYTAVFFKQPKNDIGIWYRNLKVAFEELKNLPVDSTPLEQSNLLMRIRESLIDEGNNARVTVPSGIHLYPNNVVFFLWESLSMLIFIVSLIGFSFSRR